MPPYWNRGTAPWNNLATRWAVSLMLRPFYSQSGEPTV